MYEVEFYIYYLLLSLLLTELIEIPCSFFFLKKGKGWWLVLLVNMLTNPPVVYLCILVNLYLPSAAYYPLQIVLEIVVVLIEGWIYKIFSEELLQVSQPFRMALILNAVSYGIGILIDIGANYLC